MNVETSMADLNNNFLVAFEIGTRVHCPDLYAHYTLDQSPYDTGTVAKRHLKMVDIEYGICMDCVKMLYNEERYFEKLDESPLEILFTYGSRVECQIDGSEKWFPGVVLAFDDEFIQDNNHPYIILFDYGRTRPFWGPPLAIRSCSTPIPKESRQHDLRFKVGD